MRSQRHNACPQSHAEAAAHANSEVLQHARSNADTSASYAPGLRTSSLGIPSLRTPSPHSHGVCAFQSTGLTGITTTGRFW